MLPPFVADDTHVYFANKWTVKKVPLDGGPVLQLAHGDYYIKQIVTDGTHVYWLDSSQAQVFRVSVNGGPVTPVGDGTTGTPGTLAHDATHVYWVDQSFRAIRKAPKSGGPTVTVASGLPFFSQLVTDGTNLFFVEQDSGAIQRMSVDGGPISFLMFSEPYSTVRLALDEQHLYWIGLQYLRRVLKSGGISDLIADGIWYSLLVPNGLAPDGGGVYWSETGGGTLSASFPAPTPGLQIGDVTVVEGNSGATTATFNVNLAPASPQTVTVNYATADGAATVADGDYVAASGMLAFSPGETVKPVKVTVKGDTKFESDESFLLNLSGPTNASIVDGQGRGTISNDDSRLSLCRQITSLPYTITVQGNYCLVRNLSTAQATGHAITIVSDFVVLDLKGFKIGGGAAGPGTQASGIYALNRKNITIKNGNIRGFFRAVFLEDDSETFTSSQGHLLQNVRADENTYAGIHVQGRGNVVRNNQVMTTGGTTVFGANADAYGIHTEGAGVRVLNNDVTDTNPGGTGSGFAIAVEEAAASVVEKNRLANSIPNASYGVKAASGDDVLVVGNRISGTMFGVFYDTATGKYRDNLATGVITPYTGGTDAGNNQ